MTDYAVSTNTEFNTARGLAGAGDTITLADGTYSGFTWTGKSVSTSDPLVIRAANRGSTALSSTLTLNNCAGLTFDGINCNSGLERGFGSNSYLNFQYCYFQGVVRFTSLTNGAAYRCEMNNAGVYMDLGDTSDCTIEECYLHSRSGDMIVVSGVSGIDILNCVAYDIAGSGSGPHWDLLIQGYSVSGSNDDIYIRGNIAIDNPATDIIDTAAGNQVIDGPQGIFFGGPSDGYTNLIIEQNMVWTANSNGIRMTNSATGSIIRNNSLVSGNIICNNQSGYNYSVPVENNIVNLVSDEGTGGGSPAKSGNIEFSTIGGGTAAEAFADPTGGANGILSWQRFIPKGAYSTKGAAARLAEIEAGTAVYALELAGMTGMGGGGSPPPSISGLTINLASA